jgi:VWFA-related protein
MINKRWFLLFASAGCALVLLLGGTLSFSQSQTQPPPPPPQSGQDHSQTPPLRVTTRMVQVPVVVHDKDSGPWGDGHPITGLTKDDFVLFDNGRQQKIASFSVQRSSVTANAAAAPNVFTNRDEQGAAAQPALTVIVIDAYNTRKGLVGAIFYEIERFTKQMKPQDRVALYLFGLKLYLLQDFTNDPSAIERGLERGIQLTPEPFQFPNRTAIQMSAETMEAMKVISDRLANVPGRKNLIWLSSGLAVPGYLVSANAKVATSTADKTITGEKMGETAKMLADSDLPLFAINPNGLPVGGFPTGPVGGGGATLRVDPVITSAPTPAYVTGDARLPAPRGPKGGFGPIRELSWMSGGRPFYSTNDIAGSIRRVIDDSAATYILSYYPDHNKWDGEFRDIKVKVNRPGVDVRARKGYYAATDAGTAPENAAEKMAEAIKSPLESTDLAFDVQADAEDVSGARQLKVKFSLDAGQLRFAQQGDRWSDKITIVLAEFDDVGREVASNTKSISFNPEQDAYKHLLQQGLKFPLTQPIAENAAEIHLVLRDGGNGSIGSVIIPLTKLFAAADAQSAPKN